MWVLPAILCYDDLSFDACLCVPISFQTDEVKTSRSSSDTSSNETDTTDLPSDEMTKIQRCLKTGRAESGKMSSSGHDTNFSDEKTAQFARNYSKYEMKFI